MSDVSGRYVVLTHDHPFLHWDLMLEHAGALRTWRLYAAPDTESLIVAEQLADHRLAYLEYEGPVSGGRGQVTRWDWGVYRQTEGSPERIVCELSGERLVGSIVLTTSDESTQWRACYRTSEGS